MIIKSPSKRVSQLDLKFLDLRFMSIDQGHIAQTSPLPRVAYASLAQSTINNSNTNVKQQSIHSFNLNYTTKQSKHGVSRSEEYTKDVTNEICGNSIIEQNIQMDTERVLNYLNVDTEAIYKQFGNMAPSISTLKRKNNKLINNKNDANLQPIDNEIKKYEQKIRNYEKQNQMIHNEITKMYSNQKKQKSSNAKIIRNMKLFEESKLTQIRQSPSLERYHNEMSQNYRYQSEDKRNNNLRNGFLQNYQNTIQVKPLSIIKTNAKTQNKQVRSNTNIDSFIPSENKKKVLKKSYIPSKLNQCPKYQAKDKFLPRLSKNKYEKFYEQLYRNKRDKSMENERIENKSLAQNKQMQMLAEMKKKIISNNFDKNFQAFFIQKKIRIPQFLKVLR